MMRSYVCAMILIASAPAAGLAVAAQTVPGRPPGSEYCNRAAAALARGARDVVSWQLLPSCGRAGAIAMANAFRAARSETDLAYLEKLYGAMGSSRHPAVFAAALEVMQEPSASAPARATAVLIAAAQHDRRLALPLNLSFSEVMAPSTAERCRLLPTFGGNYRSASPLPRDYLERLGTAVSRIVADPGTPQLVKSVVRCARPALGPALSAAVPLSAIRLLYVCGNRFRVTNQTAEWIDVSYKVSATEDQRDLVVAPRGETVFTTERRGSTSLFYRGKLVQSETNGGKACSS